MRRSLLAIMILLMGAVIFCVSRDGASHSHLEARSVEAVLATQSQALADAQLQLITTKRHVLNLKKDLNIQQSKARPGTFDSLSTLTGATNLSPAQCEQLLAALGFDWNTTGDYVFVSKQILKYLGIADMKDHRLREAACDVLAITGQERNAIETTGRNISSEVTAWARTNIVRAEPSGDILAQFTLPPAPEFSQGLSNRYAINVLSTLGQERGQHLLNYSHSWMTELGLCGGSYTTSMTGKNRRGADGTYLSCEMLGPGDHNWGCPVTPYQPFPQSFLPLFPNGWRDLADREGFELPKN